MITARLDPQDFLKSLRRKMTSRDPIMIASAGSGLVAQIHEEQGVDFINTFSGARLRSNGMGTMSMLWPILDSNEQTMRYTREDILPALKGRASVCACLNANDPLKDMRMVLEDCLRMGVTSVSNIGPSVSYIDEGSEIKKVLTSAGITLDNEIDMLVLAREMGLVTVGLAFTPEDSLRIAAEARPHVFCYHAGTTKGAAWGTTPAPLSPRPPAIPRLCSKRSEILILISFLLGMVPRWKRRKTRSLCWITHLVTDFGRDLQPNACPSNAR